MTWFLVQDNQDDTYNRRCSLILVADLGGRSLSSILKLLKIVLYEIEEVFVNLLDIFWKLSSCPSQQYLAQEKIYSLRGSTPHFKFETFFKKSVFSKYLFCHEEMYTWQRRKKIGSHRIYLYIKFQRNRIIFEWVTGLYILVPN